MKGVVLVLMLAQEFSCPSLAYFILFIYLFIFFFNLFVVLSCRCGSTNKYESTNACWLAHKWQPYSIDEGTQFFFFLNFLDLLILLFFFCIIQFKANKGKQNMKLQITGTIIKKIIREEEEEGEGEM